VRQGYAIARSRNRRPPSNNPYALLPDTLEFLAVLLARLAPRLVIEFGSGESTRVLAEWASAQHARVVSVEHDRRWAEEVRGRLSSDVLRAVDVRHAPLRPARGGMRQFLTYRGLEQLAPEVQQADLIVLDGPHISGREILLYFLLRHSRPGQVIVVDDLRHYCVRDMLSTVPQALAACFAGEPIEENSHGIYVLRCLRSPPTVGVPILGVRAIARSYWRCLLDLRHYGTGD
jgi:predicted O-methyltransferase YrrM